MVLSVVGVCIYNLFSILAELGLLSNHKFLEILDFLLEIAFASVIADYTNLVFDIFVFYLNCAVF